MILVIASYKSSFSQLGIEVDISDSIHFLPNLTAELSFLLTAGNLYFFPSEIGQQDFTVLRAKMSKENAKFIII